MLLVEEPDGSPAYLVQDGPGNRAVMRWAQRDFLVGGAGGFHGNAWASGGAEESGYTWSMARPSTKPKEARVERPLVAHPDDAADVRAGLDEAERGELLSAEESAAYIRSLLDAPRDATSEK